jgi:ABC-type molybdate transport system substrate-binding protein
MISGGYAAAFEELAPRFEAAAGIGVVIIHGPSMGAAPQSIPNRLARGEAEIGFQQPSELQPIKGITIAGLLPAEVQKATTISAGIVKGAASEEAGRSLIRRRAYP